MRYPTHISEHRELDGVVLGDHDRERERMVTRKILESEEPITASNVPPELIKYEEVGTQFLND